MEATKSSLGKLTFVNLRHCNVETFDSLEGIDAQQLISTLDEGRKEENGKIVINI